jgi:hypothetical protein
MAARQKTQSASPGGDRFDICSRGVGFGISGQVLLIVLTGVFFLSTGGSRSMCRAASPEAGLQDVPSPARNRLIVETDAGGDPDDEQSMVRFLLYANEWDLEGIIATRDRARDRENRNPERTGLGIVRRLIRAYGECHSHLVQHDERYPSVGQLLERTVAGYGGDDGVELILKAVDSRDPRPVWYLNWGTEDHGPEGSSFVRALDRVLKERGAEGYARFKNRLRLSSADRFGRHAAAIAPPFPLWVDTFRPNLKRRRWYHRFSALTATAGGFNLERDLLTGHGPLGALYPTNTSLPQKEGDTMTFLYLVPTGLNDPDHPEWGSWAGRYGRQEKFPNGNYYWANERDTWNGTTHRDMTLARFAADLQNDFRARLDWCVQPVSEANHPPVVRIAGSRHRKAMAGERVLLDASATTDPDGDELTFDWWIYHEAAPHPGMGRLENAHTPKATFVPASDQSGGAVHVVLTVTDGGSPPLTRYGRVIISSGKTAD